MSFLLKTRNILSVASLAVILAGCQLQNTGSSTSFSVTTPNPAAAGTETTSGDDAQFLQLASLARLPVPGIRPYDRSLYQDDILLDIVPNPAIDAVTGRELSLLSPAARRRQAALPYSRRSVLYNPIIRKYARLNGLDYEFVRAVIFSESTFRVNALGRAGEIGLMQVKPATARGLGYRGSRNQLYIPENNIKYGIMYLKKAKDRSDGSICGTILKYNAGLYSKGTNPVSTRYCSRVKRYMRLSKRTNS